MTLNLFGLEYPSSQTFAFIVTLKTKQRSLGCLSLIHARVVLTIQERERERKRDDEDTRFAKNVDVVCITDAVEPAVELSALRVDFLLVEYNLLTSSFHFPSIQCTRTEIKISHQNAHEREPGDD